MWIETKFELITQNYPEVVSLIQDSLLNRENTTPNMEKKDWKARMRQLGLAGVLFFTVKGIITLTLGGWLLSKLGCGE